MRIRRASPNGRTSAVISALSKGRGRWVPSMAMGAVHVLIVYGLLFCLPFTKLRHFLIAPVNLYFRSLKPRGRLAPIKDFENAETFGVSQVEQYPWKQLLDMTSCLECGRCTINCPTVNTGKTLNPKFLVIAQREHLLDKAPYLLAAQAAGRVDGTWQRRRGGKRHSTRICRSRHDH